MIKNSLKLEKFERELVKNTPVDYYKNLQIVEQLYEEAKKLGVFPLKDPLDGIDTIIKLAKVLHSVPSILKE